MHAPSYIATAMLKCLVSSLSDNLKQNITEMIPLKIFSRKYKVKKIFFYFNRQGQMLVVVSSTSVTLEYYVN